MSVLIKGMKMPFRCFNCGFYQLDDEESLCAGMGSGTVVGYENVDADIAITSRPDWCPLIEVPAPHGRLIDESWLKNAMITTLEALKKNPKMDRQEMHLIAAFDTLRAMLEDAPTVIEAEE